MARRERMGKDLESDPMAEIKSWTGTKLESDILQDLTHGRCIWGIDG